MYGKCGPSYTMLQPWVMLANSSDTKPLSRWGPVRAEVGEVVRG